MLVRTSEKRLLRAASFGSNSVNRTPGIRVAMVAKGPRYSTGAFGLGSNRSRWLGPPPSQTSKTDRAFGAGGVAAAAECIPAQAKGTAQAARRKDRRPTPWQSRVKK